MAASRRGLPTKLKLPLRAHVHALEVKYNEIKSSIQRDTGDGSRFKERDAMRRVHQRLTLSRGKVGAQGGLGREASRFSPFSS